MQIAFVFHSFVLQMFSTNGSVHRLELHVFFLCDLSASEKFCQKTTTQIFCVWSINGYKRSGQFDISNITFHQFHISYRIKSVRRIARLRPVGYWHHTKGELCERAFGFNSFWAVNGCLTSWAHYLNCDFEWRRYAFAWGHTTTTFYHSIPSQVPFPSGEPGSLEINMLSRGILGHSKRESIASKPLNRQGQVFAPEDFFLSLPPIRRGSVVDLLLESCMWMNTPLCWRSSPSSPLLHSFTSLIPPSSSGICCKVSLV